MASIKLKEILISGGFGAVDLGLDLYPVTISGLNAQDIVRVGSTIGSYVLNFMGRYERETEVLFFSSLPLTIKSVYNWVKGYVGGGGTKTAKYTLEVTPPSASKKLEFIGIR